MKDENLLVLKKIFSVVLDLNSNVEVESIRKIDTTKWDSLASVSFQAAVESELGLELDIEELFEITSFKMMVLVLSDKGL
jgi:acyl carrier protein